MYIYRLINAGITNYRSTVKAHVANKLWINYRSSLLCWSRFKNFSTNKNLKMFLKISFSGTKRFNKEDCNTAPATGHKSSVNFTITTISFYIFGYDKGIPSHSGRNIQYFVNLTAVAAETRWCCDVV